MKAIYEKGLDFLSQNGVKNPRPIIGKWRSEQGKKHGKTKGDQNVMDAINSAIKCECTEPVAYITRILNNGGMSADMRAALDAVYE